MEISASEGCDLVIHILTKNKDEKQLSAFYGWLYEDVRDEEEEQRIAEAEEIQTLLNLRKGMTEED